MVSDDSPAHDTDVRATVVKTAIAATRRLFVRFIVMNLQVSLFSRVCLFPSLVYIYVKALRWQSTLRFFLLLWACPQELHLFTPE
ncbi:hypothetical protein CH291_07065 [Rhodococcus sp. 14-1411-2a]|nr:hypothetical protein CH291_07065 [Rhodococcus sp. 14-1411-2a]